MVVIIDFLDAIEVDFHKQVLALISKFIPNVELIEKLNKYTMKCNDFKCRMCLLWLYK